MDCAFSKQRTYSNLIQTPLDPYLAFFLIHFSSLSPRDPIQSASVRILSFFNSGSGADFGGDEVEGESWESGMLGFEVSSVPFFSESLIRTVSLSFIFDRIALFQSTKVGIFRNNPDFGW